MRTAIIGYGKMGHEVEQVALERGHTVDLIIDADNTGDLNSDNLQKIDAAIEFTSPETAADNIIKCLQNNTPVVSGSTGWLDKWDEVAKVCKDHSGALFYASNYSIGVNILFAINSKLAEIMNQFPRYNVSMVEVHHIHKLDAPSGTAISLADQITEKSTSKRSWSLETDNPEKIYIDARREGEVSGFHKVIYDSEIDSIEISHNAKSRKGFATGAVMAAEFTAGKKGIFGMKDMFNF